MFKVETIGDSYMGVAGCPDEDDESCDHALHMALDMIAIFPMILKELNVSHLNIRVGLHNGPIIGGVIGQKNPRWHLFGDTGNGQFQIYY